MEGKLSVFNMIKCEKITKTFKRGKHLALDNINLEISNEFVLGILGNSGCGKSTLARVISGIIKYDSGKVIYDDFSKEKVHLIFQNPQSALNPKYKIKNALNEAIAISGHDKKDILKLFKRFELSEILLDRYPHQISGGEAQRICICRGILLDPKVIILDEATSMLDVSNQALVISQLKELQKIYHYSIVVISHDIGLLINVCNKIVLMNEGKIIETVNNIYDFQTELGKEMIDNYIFFKDGEKNE